MTWPWRSILIAAAAVCILTPCASVSGIDAIYAFGDSLTDAGNIYNAVGIPAAPPYYNGEFSKGPVWVQDVAAGLGLPALTPSRLGGTDYAYRSGETAPESFNIDNVATDIPGPTGQLTLTSASVDPNALCTIWIGSNDLADIAATDPGHAAADLGTTPLAATLGAQGFPTSLSAGLDTTLVNGSGALSIPSLAALAGTDGINLRVLNTYALLDSIRLSPSTYGLINVTDPCLVGSTPCANPSKYLFWDDQHPSAAGHAIVADAALAVLAPERGSMTLIGAGLFAVVLIRRRVTA